MKNLSQPSQGPGPESINAKIIKQGAEALGKTIHELIEDIWKQEYLPVAL